MCGGRISSVVHYQSRSIILAILIIAMFLLTACSGSSSSSDSTGEGEASNPPLKIVNGVPVNPDDYAPVKYLAIVTFEQPYNGPVAGVSGSGVQLEQMLLLAGYGRAGYGDQQTGTLRAGVTTVDAYSFNQGLMYWAFNETDESSICNGDSGGPSFIQDISGYLLLVGVHSATLGGCELGSVGIDTFISQTDLLQWLINGTGGSLHIM